MGIDQLYSGNYNEMLKAAESRLEGRDPLSLAQACGFDFDSANNVFRTRSLGVDMVIQWPDLSFVPDLDVWQRLTVLQYMDAADGSRMTGKDMSLKEFRVGGLVRGASFDAQCDDIARKSLGKSDDERIKRVAGIYGGIVCDGIADINIEFSFLPNFRYKMCLWYEDDEFPASCRMLCDSSAERYLNVEAAGMMAVRILEMMEAGL